MKLGSQMDYHGPRAYAPDPPSTTGSWISRYRRRVAAWRGQMFEMLLKPGARQAAETISLIDGREKHFSLLGLDGNGRSRGATAPCPFPEGEGRARRLVRPRPDNE